jgi:SAM-dependent methyltransferase/uncharacterized protein YbaR (Trm112 family)
MRRDALAVLCCPACAGALAADGGADVPDDGAVCCTACGARHPVRGGVLDLLGAPRPATAAQWVNELRLTAWAYERTWRPHALSLLSGEPFGEAREAALLAAAVADAPAGAFVDLACSSGRYARALAGMAPQRTVIGIDCSAAMLVEAQRRARAARLPISYVRADVLAPPLRPATAAAVVMGGSLNEIADAPGALAAMAHSATPGAALFLMTLLGAGSTAGRLLQRLLQPGGLQFFDGAALDGHIRAAGFDITDRRIHRSVALISGRRRVPADSGG